MQKGTKNALETGRTFATLFADMDLRLRLLVARTEGEFKRLMWEHMKELAEEQSVEFKRLMWEHMKELAEEQSDETSRRKLSQDSSEEKVEEALPRVKESLRPYLFQCRLRL